MIHTSKRHRPTAARAIRLAARSLIEGLEPRLLMAGEPLINEFLADNLRNPKVDRNGQHADWIELFNPGPDAVDLAGWQLVDDLVEDQPWTFPATILPAGAYLIVFADGDNDTLPSPELHTNFRIDDDGGYLALLRPDGSVATEFNYPDQDTDVSYGFAPGGTTQFFTTPTPGAANNTGVEGLVADTTFSRDHGFYDAPFDLTLDTLTEGAEIRYTLDGSLPTATTGLVYTTPLRIDKTTIIRTAAFKPGFLASNVDTQTYVFVNSVVNQPNNPAGYPVGWGTTSLSPPAANRADYEMDPEVVNSPAYRDRIRDDLKSLPVMSIVMKVDDLFKNTNVPAGTAGIYSFPESAGAAWERPGSLELFYPDGREGFQIDAGFQIQGGASRTPNNSPKHAIRVLFKSIYGASELDYDLFENQPDAVQEFDSLILRAGYNDTFIHHNTTGGDQRSRSDYIKDQWMRDTLREMNGLPQSHGMYVHLYINGMYWGLYNPSERPEENFAVSYLGGEQEDYDVFSNEEVLVHGTRTAWDTMFNIANAASISTPAGYTDIQRYLDVEAFADYMLVNFFGGNQDWDDHNWYAVRRSRENGVDKFGEGFQYRFYSWDAERTLEDLSHNKLTENRSKRPSGLFQRLRLNPEFRLLFADRVQKHLFNGGALTPGPAAERYRALAEIVDEAIVAESARWGDYRRDVNPRGTPTPIPLYTVDNTFVPERDRILNSYFPGRTNAMIAQLRSNSPLLYPTVDAPTFSQFGGNVADNYVLSITKNASQTGVIYYTTDGTDPRTPGGGVSASARQYTGSITLAQGTRVKSRVFATTDNWSALTDATFFVGAAPSLRVTEVMYNPAGEPGVNFGDDAFEYIELQNTGATALDASGITFTRGVDFTFPSGFVIQPGQRVMVVGDTVAFQQRYGNGITVAGEFLGDLSNNGEGIALTTAVGHPILDFEYDAGWYDNTDGGGYSLVARNPSASNAALSSKNGWRPSQLTNGGPGTADPGIDPESIVISEVMSVSTDPEGEFIEFHNRSSQPIDMGGWGLSDDDLIRNKFVLTGPAIIGPGQYFVIDSPFPIDDAGARIFLTQYVEGPMGGYRESVDFSSSDPDVSFGRHTKSNGNVDFVAMASPTPGIANSAPRVGPVVISEIHYNPANANFEFIELRNTGTSAVDLFDPANPGNTWRFTDGINFALPAGQTLLPGQYALVVPIDPAEFRTKYNVPADALIFGPYDSVLDSRGEKVELSKPGVPQIGGIVPNIVVDRVHYDPASPWPSAANGFGSALQRLMNANYGNDAENWTASSFGGSPGANPPPNLTLAGTNGSDVYYLRLSNDGSQLQLYQNNPSLIGSPTFRFAKGALTALTIDAGGGADELVVDFSNGNPLPDTGISFTGGAGTDRVRIIGGDDDDTLELSLAGLVYNNLANGIQSSQVEDVRLEGNGGDDSMTVNDKLPFTVGVTGGEGHDTLTVNSGAGTDVVTITATTITLSPLLVNNTSVEQVILDTGAGIDTVTANGTPPGFDLVLRTGEGADTLRANSNTSTFAQVHDPDVLALTMSSFNPANPSTLNIGSSVTFSTVSLSGNSRLNLLPGGGDVLRTGALTLATGARIDLADNDLVVTAAPDALEALLDVLNGHVKRGRDTNGTAGIISSAAINDLSRLTTLAVVNKNGEARVKYTWAGDLDGSGDVSLDDVFILDAALLMQPSPAPAYRRGDVDYNGVLDLDDRLLMDRAFLGQGDVFA